MSTMSGTPNRPLRVVSLLPSATEKLALIGGLDLLVGRSHECDYPASASNVPVLTSSRLTFESSKQIDEDVSKALSEGKGLYNLDAAKLAELRPDVILTQDICNVCSIDLAAVQRTASKMNPPPKIVSLDPGGLKDVLRDVAKVGDAVGLGAEARRVQEQLEERIKVGMALASEARAERERKGIPPPKVAFLEWTEPTYVGGHWTPELIEMAGGTHPLNPAGSDPSGGSGKSFAVPPESVTELDPDFVIISPCGLNLDDTEVEVSRMMDNGGAWFEELRAVREGNAASVDGNQMFNRPGPRLVDAFEWLVWFLNVPESSSPLAARNPPQHLASFPWRPWTSSSRRPPATKAPQPKATVKKGPGYPTCMPPGGLSPDIEEAHRAAVCSGQDMYTDPATGYMVFTEDSARKRGFCCGRRCRHCPYGHFNVPSETGRQNVIKIPTLCPHTKLVPGGDEPVTVYFWSGGKDSWMALQRYRQKAEARGREVLLTTHGEDGIVQEQDVPLTRVMDQAKALKMDIMVVPLPSACDNDAYVSAVTAAINQLIDAYRVNKDGSSASQCTLVFGDLHLADIRNWRETSFGPSSALGAQCSFPLFGVAYAELQAMLFSQGGKGYAGGVGSIVVSSVPAGGKGQGSVQVGDTFDAGLIKRLQDGGIVDAFGERGEFHTEVLFGAGK